MNSKQLFEIALGNIQPWFIEKIEFMEGADKSKELHIHLDFPKGSTFQDESGKDCKAYDTKQHTWRHLKRLFHRSGSQELSSKIIGSPADFTDLR